MEIDGIPLYRCAKCGKEHLTWTGPWASTRPTACPCGEPFQREVCDVWRRVPSIVDHPQARWFKLGPPTRIEEGPVVRAPRGGIVYLDRHDA